jgi:hypothetical protein
MKMELDVHDMLKLAPPGLSLVGFTALSRKGKHSISARSKLPHFRRHLGHRRQTVCGRSIFPVSNAAAEILCQLSTAGRRLTVTLLFHHVSFCEILLGHPIGTAFKTNSWQSTKLKFK